MTYQDLGRHACPNGHPVRPSARFCPACGANVVHEFDQTAAGYATQPTEASWPTETTKADAVGAPAAPRRSWTLVALLAAVLLILGAGGGTAALYLSRRADPASTGAAAGATPSPTATASVPTSASPSESPYQSPSGSASGSPFPESPSSSAGATLGIVDISAIRADPRAETVGWTLNEYYSGINSRDIQRTLAVMDPAGAVNRNNPGQVERFRADVSTTTDANVVVHWLTDDATPGSVQAGVTFTSRQDAAYGPNGQTCTNWSLTYFFVPNGGNGGLLIRRTAGTNTPC